MTQLFTQTLRAEQAAELLYNWLQKRTTQAQLQTPMTPDVLEFQSTAAAMCDALAEDPDADLSGFSKKARVLLNCSVWKAVNDLAFGSHNDLRSESPLSDREWLQTLFALSIRRMFDA